jgi:putative membrane protein insertion efficiency factor
VNGEVIKRLVKGLGWPVRTLLLALVRGYRLTLGQATGGRCRFYPSCSAYAEEAIQELGWVRGVGLTLWRVLRCSPLSSGGVDYPPGHQERQPEPTYDSGIHSAHNDPSQLTERVTAA